MPHVYCSGSEQSFFNSVEDVGAEPIVIITLFFLHTLVACIVFVFLFQGRDFMDTDVNTTVNT